jgi:hypothetical protein
VSSGVGDGWPVDIPALRTHVMSEGGTRREGHRTSVGRSCSRSGSGGAGKSVPPIRAWAGRKRGGNPKPTGRPIRPEKPLASGWVTVLQTDTGRQVEDTKARERTLVKELGNLTP